MGTNKLCSVLLVIALSGFVQSEGEKSKAPVIKVKNHSKSGDRTGNEEKLDTASQSLFGYNSNGANPGGSGGFGGSGSTGYLGNGFGSNGYTNQFTNSLGSGRGNDFSGGGFGQGISSFGGNGFGNGFNGLSSLNQGFGQGQYTPFGNQGFSNGIYQGQGQFGQGLFGGNGGFGGNSGFGGLSSGFGNGFSGYPQFGGINQGQGFYQGQQTDRNLGFANQGFGNPLYTNRSPSSSLGSLSNISPGLGSLQVGNRVDVSSGNRGSYFPSGGPGGFSTSGGSLGQFGGFGRLGQSQGLFGGGFGGQQFNPSSASDLYNNYNGINGFNGLGGGLGNPYSGGIQGGIYRQSNPFGSQFDYLNRAAPIGLRGAPVGGAGGSSSPAGPGGPPRIGAVGGEGPSNRLQSTGPNRFYQGTNPAGAFGRGGERIHRFTSSDETA